ncbi:MAG TPA: hypothetical protein V6C90_20870 [Coleofasciculaceae cyanobacterium]
MAKLTTDNSTIFNFRVFLDLAEEIEEVLQRSNRLIDCQQTESCLSGIVVGGMMTPK